MTPAQRLELADELERRALCYCEKVIPENYAREDKSRGHVWADVGTESLSVAADLFTVAAALRRLVA